MILAIEKQDAPAYVVLKSNTGYMTSNQNENTGLITREGRVMTKEDKIPYGNKCYTITYGDNYHYREEDSVKKFCPFWSLSEGGYCSRIKTVIQDQTKECGENM